MHDVIALDGGVAGEVRADAAGWPDIEIDDVLVAMVDERRHRPPVEIIEPPAGKRKPLWCEVLDRRREIDAAVEPRLDRVLVGRDDVFEMARLQRADMPGDDLPGEVVALRQQDQERQRGGAGGTEAEPEAGQRGTSPDRRRGAAPAPARREAPEGSAAP